jgi:hypothetical protein
MTAKDILYDTRARKRIATGGAPTITKDGVSVDKPPNRC